MARVMGERTVLRDLVLGMRATRAFVCRCILHALPNEMAILLICYMLCNISSDGVVNAVLLFFLWGTVVGLRETLEIAS